MRLGRSVAVSTLGYLAPPVSALGTAPILARTLGVTDRGETAAAVAPLILAMGVLTLGIPEAATVWVARGHRSSRGALLGAGCALGTASVLGVATIYVVSRSLAQGDRELETLIEMSSWGLPAGLLLMVFRGVAAGRGRWGLIALERGVMAGVRLVVVVVVALTGQMSVNVAVATLVLTTVGGVVMYLPLIVSSRRRGGERTVASNSVHGYAGRMWVGTLAGMVLARADQAMFSSLSTFEQLGVYAVAVSIAEVVLVFNSAVRDVIFATESGVPDLARSAMAARISTLLTVASATVVGLAAVWGLPVLFGKEFESATWVLIILLVGISVGNSGSVGGAVLSARGHPGLRSISLTLAVVANIASLLLLLPPFGAVGAAICTVLGNAVAALANLIFVKRLFGSPISSFVVPDRGDLLWILSTTRRTRERLVKR